VTITKNVELIVPYVIGENALAMSAKRKTNAHLALYVAKLRQALAPKMTLSPCRTRLLL